MDAGPVLLHQAGPVARLRLNRPDRHNSLVPDLIETLIDRLAAVAADGAIRVLVLEANGPSFSTGGDVRGFFDTPPGQRRAYADQLVGGLNRAILTLLDLPCPVIGRIHGPLTGGSLGFLLACDLAVIAPQAFIQPYYTEVGFSPDGGWTAMLPDRIGPQKSREIQLLNRRVGAAEAVSLGLATALAETDRLDTVIAGWIAELEAKQPGAVACTKRRLLPPEKRAAVAAALDAERQDFIDQIETAEAQDGMARFLGRIA